MRIEGIRTKNVWQMYHAADVKILGLNSRDPQDSNLIVMSVD